MKALAVWAAVLLAAAAWGVWRQAERAANRADAFREIRRPRRLSETAAMRRASEWVPD